MTSQDFDYIRSVTSSDRVWVGDEIASEYYRDEMPEYGVFPPELYVEAENKEEVSAIMGYAYLGYAALITLFIPAVSHAIIIKWRTVTFYYGSGIWLSELNRNITRTSSILSRFLPYTSYDNPYPDTISHHFP